MISAMNHCPDYEGACMECERPWPCETAEVRRELAEYLRAMPLTPSDYAMYDDGRRDGYQSAADRIDIED